ncbi:MAG: hypothetical protein BroJett022_10880 [Actinomycetes bacterium]|nr:MAG: hypothetical protein BroJett022_10880 [Actinomycetes bacterium]
MDLDRRPAPSATKAPARRGYGLGPRADRRRRAREPRPGGVRRSREPRIDGGAGEAAFGREPRDDAEQAPRGPPDEVARRQIKEEQGVAAFGREPAMTPSRRLAARQWARRPNFSRIRR